MCGIVGYVGPRDAAPILLDGLRRLEYRGYDSAGIALLTESGEVFVEKKAGKLTNLTDHLNGGAPAGHPGIAHTRWATHGRPNDANAHPHTDCSGQLALIHNGIIENYREIKDRLLAAGHRFTSETDTEVLAHLIEQEYDGDLVEAVRRALQGVRGAYAIGVMHTAHPDRIVGARMNVPLIVGLGRGEGFLASDVPAILEHTKNVVILQEGDIADVTADGVRIVQLDGADVERDVTRISWNIEAAEKGGFAHFTLKEIYEQPHAIQEALRGRVAHSGAVTLAELEPIEEALRAAERVYVVGCGTARYAAEVGAHLIQEWAGLPASAQIGSEMRYSPPPIDERTLVISVSQSGETADTLAPTRLADERGATIVVVTNVVGSALTRDADAVCYLQAGPEVAVASTKAFVTQVVVLELIALRLAQLRGRMSEHRVSVIGRGMRELPRHGRRGRWPWRRRSRSWRSAGAGSATSCTSAARWASRSPWRARSSSRSSPTSMPRAMPPASSSTDRSRCWTATRHWWRSPPAAPPTRRWSATSPRSARARRRWWRSRPRATRRSLATPPTSSTCRRCWRS